jgi:hypothetical protein
MIEKIRANLKDPEKLERLYQEDKRSFRSAFEEIYPEISDYELAKFWKSRLDFARSTGKTKHFMVSDILTMISVCLFAAFLIKFPELFKINITNFSFYERETGIIMFLALSLYTIIIKKSLSKNNIAVTMLIFGISAIYINLLPNIRNSATINLVYIHMPILMWCLYGLVFIDFDIKDYSKRIGFIRHNGDLAIMGGLILIAGGILMAITILLFNGIGIDIKNFYMNYIAISGFVCAPVVATFVLRNYAALTDKIAPVISSIFSPLVLLTLLIYVVAMAVSGKDPYLDRDFLLTFNLMLIGVMSIIIFSVSETSLFRRQRFNELLLLALSLVTLITNIIALSAIFYRLSEFGLTPNRMAVLGSNILIFVNLILISIDLFKIFKKKSELHRVENTISKFLPFYIIWILVVVFAFPFIFGMK